MQFELAQFKILTKDFHKVSKFISAGKVNLDYSYGDNYQIQYTLGYSGLQFRTVARMAAFCKDIHIPIDVGSGINNLGTPASAVWEKLKTTPRDQCTMRYISKEDSQWTKTVKLIPKTVALQNTPNIIKHAPPEVTEGDFTYRFLTSRGGPPQDGVARLEILARNDEPIYDYLDKGFFVMHLPGKKTGGASKKYIVADEYDVNVAHVMAMCKLQTSLAEHLKDKCFVSVYNAELTRLKFEKKLTEVNRKAYTPIKEAIEDDYRKNTTLIVVGKLMNNDIAKTEINNIRFTKTTASYENISIEAPDLLEVLYSKLNFNGEYDIYVISEIYSQHVEGLLEAAKEAIELPEIKVNGIPIVASMTGTFQRYLNKIRINKNEIGQALHRASCSHTEQDYNLFLKSISRMSIRWHDVISNGLQVKIHEMDQEELRDPNPGVTAPSLKFFVNKETKQINLRISEDRGVRVSLSKIVKKVDTVNRKTNGGYHYDPKNRYNRRGKNGEWCAKEMVQVLIDSCTFVNSTKGEDGVVIAKKEVTITKEDITKLLSIAQEAKIKAIKRSKEFLETAIKMTGAVAIEFLGKAAYQVAGTLRSYAVVIDNAKVYDLDTKQYRCIVNDHHYIGTGYDDIAARLLALKNDSMMQAHIGTLAGGPQPGAENIHNDYVPERDTEDSIDELLAKDILD